MPRLSVELSIGFPNVKRTDVINIDDVEWDACDDDDEREELIEERAKEWASNYIEISAHLV